MPRLRLPSGVLPPGLLSPGLRPLAALLTGSLLTRSLLTAGLLAAPALAQGPPPAVPNAGAAPVEAPVKPAAAANYPDLFGPNAAGGVVRAGYQRPAAAAPGSGILRTAAEVPAPAAGNPLGEPAANLDFFLAPVPVPAAAPMPAATPEPVAEAGPQPSGPTSGPQPEPQPERSAVEPAAPSAFSAADFGFGEDPEPAPAAAPKRDAEVKTADLTADPFADDPFVVPAAAGPAPDPFADPFAAPVNPLADPPADDPAGETAEAPSAELKRTASAIGRDAGVNSRIESELNPQSNPESGPAVPDAAIVSPGSPSAAGATAIDFASAPLGPQTAAVSVRWVRRGPVRVGRPCVAELVVANDGPGDARDLKIVGSIPAALNLTAAEPAPDRGLNSDRPVWTLPALAAGEERAIVVTYRPTTGGNAALGAAVRTTLVAADAVSVTEPKLAVAVEGVSEALLGEPATQNIVVSNAGTGAVDEVLIEAVLPEGLEHRGGPKRLTMNVGALAAGESKPVRLALIASAGGVQTIVVKARGEGGLVADAEAAVHVKSPQIELAIAGPSLRYVNREATVALTVSNPGETAAENVRLGYRVPAGFAFLDADKSGTHDPAGRTVRWFLGRIEPGESLTTAVQLKATADGEQVHRAEVSASSRAKASAEHVTRVAGTASLVLTIDDSDDPVEVGAATTYTVTVKNEGTAPAKTVGLACRLPEGADLGPVRGPAASRRETRLVLFDSLPELKPGKTAVYTIRVTGTTPGSKRFQTRLVSESISEPLIHEEITKFYAE